MQEIRLDTFAGLLERGYSLQCWCSACRRWASCNIRELVENGLGKRDPLRCRPRCRKCGSIGSWQVRAPMPEFAGFAQYGMQQNKPRRELSPGLYGQPHTLGIYSIGASANE